MESSLFFPKQSINYQQSSDKKVFTEKSSGERTTKGKEINQSEDEQIIFRQKFDFLTITTVQINWFGVRTNQTEKKMKRKKIP